MMGSVRSNITLLSFLLVSTFSSFLIDNMDSVRFGPPKENLVETCSLLYGSEPLEELFEEVVVDWWLTEPCVAIRGKRHRKFYHHSNLNLTKIGNHRTVTLSRFLDGDAVTLKVESDPASTGQQRIYLADVDSYSEGSSVTEKTVTFADSSPKKLYLVLAKKERGETPLEQKLIISLSRGGHSFLFTLPICSAGHKHESSPGAKRARREAHPEYLFFHAGDWEVRTVNQDARQPILD